MGAGVRACIGRAAAERTCLFPLLLPTPSPGPHHLTLGMGPLARTQCLLVEPEVGVQPKAQPRGAVGRGLGFCST